MNYFPTAYGAVVAFVFGAVIGSFLNVVIWRLPRGQSLSHPPSHCPRCDRRLAWWENIPLASFLALRARCRTCKAPISWRYFGVELLTALLFLVLFLHFGPTIKTLAYCLFTAALVASLFIDLELFIIPDQLNTFALLVGIGLNAWGIAQGWPNEWLWGIPRSLVGAVVCAAVFVGIQALGLALFHKDAMGDGDVKLARAIGAMLPLPQALVSFLLAIAAGAALGAAMLLWQASRAKGEEPGDGRLPVDDGDQEGEPEPSTWRDLLGRGVIYLTFCDLALQLGRFLRIPPAVRLANSFDPPMMEGEEDDFVPGPTHIPFGPYMVIGALLAVFVGDRLIHWYLAWSHLA
jgi:leader peptidase (prepilin peptidase)/N-methyltransferase